MLLRFHGFVKIIIKNIKKIIWRKTVAIHDIFKKKTIKTRAIEIELDAIPV